MAGHEIPARTTPSARCDLPGELFPELTMCVYPRGRSPVRAYLSRLAAGSSRISTRHALTMLARLACRGRLGPNSLPWHELTASRTSTLREVVADLYAPATANRVLAALRGVLRECWRLEYLDREAYERAADLGQVRGISPLRGRELGEHELRELFRACSSDATVRGVRDLALLRLLFATGLRRAEVAAIQLADLDLEGLGKDEDGAPILEIEVVGKGARRRVVELQGPALDALRAWLAVRGRRRGALFLASHPTGGLVGRGLTGQAIERVCARRAVESGLRPLTPHDFRRTVASRLLEEFDPVTVSEYLGHSKLDTVKRYDRRGARGRRKAARSLARV